MLWFGVAVAEHALYIAVLCMKVPLAAISLEGHLKSAKGGKDDKYM